MSIGRRHSDSTVVEPAAGRGRSGSQRSLPRISVDFREPSPSQPRYGSDIEVIGTLGEGGMGKVLLARQHALRRDVAVKVLRDSTSDSHRSALLEEGAIIGSLEHPSVVPVHALGLDDHGRPVLVMKRIDGVSLSELLDDPTHALWGEQPTTEDRWRRSTEILIQVCNAVHFAHAHAILHRDIKPSNVLIGHHGDVYLVDWGVALPLNNDTAHDVFAGTPCFAAPEMVVGENLSPRTDVYLLGATLHAVLTGEARHTGDKSLEVMAAAVVSKPVDYDGLIPDELANLANRATAPDPADRPQSAAEFRQSLRDYLDHRSSAMLSASAVARLSELRRLSEDLANEADPDQMQRVDELAIEARFALDQALEQWPNNEEARTARAELDRLFAERRERDRALRQVAQDQDKMLSAKQRAYAGGVIALLGLVLSAVGIWGPTPTVASLTKQAAVPWIAAMVLLIVFRKPLRRTLPNRSAATAIITVTTGIFISRLLGLIAGSPVSDVLTRDLLIAAAGAASLATTLSRSMLLVSATLVAAAAMCVAWPSRAMVPFSIATGVSLVLLALREALRQRG